MQSFKLALTLAAFPLISLLVDRSATYQVNAPGVVLLTGATSGLGQDSAYDLVRVVLRGAAHEAATITQRTQRMQRSLGRHVCGSGAREGAADAEELWCVKGEQGGESGSQSLGVGGVVGTTKRLSEWWSGEGRAFSSGFEVDAKESETGSWVGRRT